jgi:integrase
MAGLVRHRWPLCSVLGGRIQPSRVAALLRHTHISVLVRQTARAAGIEKPVSAHTLRHTCATHMFKNGADILLVSQLLGHSDVRVTQIYVRVAGIDVKKAHQETYPREKDPVEKERVEPFILWKRGVAHV